MYTDQHFDSQGKVQILGKFSWGSPLWSLRALGASAGALSCSLMFAGLESDSYMLIRHQESRDRYRQGSLIPVRYPGDEDRLELVYLDTRTTARQHRWAALSPRATSSHMVNAIKGLRLDDCSLTGSQWAILHRRCITTHIGLLLDSLRYQTMRFWHESNVI